MKVLLIVVALLAALTLLGWISFHTTESSATVTVDRQEIRDDAEQAATAAKEAIRQVDAAITTEPSDRKAGPADANVDEDPAPQVTP